MKKEKCCSQKNTLVVDGSLEYLTKQTSGYKKEDREAIISLDQTVQSMNSSDYRERFIAEYYQTKIRYEKLKSFCNKIEAAEIMNTPKPKHDCPLHILKMQQKAMGEYLHILEIRAVIEKIDL